MLDLQQFWHEFKTIGQAALSMNHYDLAELTQIKDPELWKKFLMEPEVSSWVNGEISLIHDSELKKILKDINKSHSVGQAQLINTLAKLRENKNTKEGPIFVYCYIPLSDEQKHTENIIELNADPFLKEMK